MLALTSCIKETELTRPGNDEVPLHIVPTIIEATAGGIDATTRAKITGAFPIGSVMGLRISAPAASPPIASFYDSFYGLFGGDAWRYYLNDVSAGTVLSGLSSWGNIELSAYYPYDDAATDLTAIPFSIATLNGAEAVGSEMTLTDYMVAGTQTKNMTTGTPSGELALEFHHLMTAIDLLIHKTGNANAPILRLASVTFKIEGGREFVIAGTYNAINPDMTNMQNNINAAGRTTATQMTFTYPSSPNISTTRGARLLLMMPELRQNTDAGNEDATITMTFSLTDQDGSPYLIEGFADGNPVVTFNLSSITNSGTTDKGLLAGYSYAVQAIVDTYIRFAAPATGTPTPPHVNYVIEDADDDNHIEI